MTRSYQQYCPLARALDVIGDRWTLLVLRELLFSPKRFTDLQQRLEGIAPNLLSRRLKELEAAGLIERRALPPPAAAQLYDLTDKGRALEDALFELARWGVQFLGSFQGGEAFQTEWLLPVLEEMADRDAARGVHEIYEVHLGDTTFWVKVADGEVTVRPGGAPEPPDLTIRTDLDTFMAVGFGTMSPEEAVASGRSVVTGDLATARRMLDILAPAAITTRLMNA